VSEILLVDDRPENLVALRAILEPLGHDLILADSGEEALRALLLHDPSVILLDVRMPGLDGFETADLIKRRERTRDIPIVFLTAISKDSGQVFQGYEKGAVDYLFKPFEPEILRAKVTALVDLHERAEALRLKEEALRERELAELRRTGTGTSPTRCRRSSGRRTRRAARTTPTAGGSSTPGSRPRSRARTTSSRAASIPTTSRS
jgi:CheY-like chemotaxis protein